MPRKKKAEQTDPVMLRIEYAYSLFMKVTHYFSKESGQNLSVKNDDQPKETMSRQENNHHSPGLAKGLKFFWDNNWQEPEIKNYCYGQPNTYQEFVKKLAKFGNVDSSADVLLVPFESFHKRIWYINNNRILVHVNEKDYLGDRMKYERWKNAQYLLLYKWNDPEVSRLFKLDKYMKPKSLTPVKELNEETGRCPGLDHNYYLDFHWIPNEYYDIWYVDWLQIFKKKNFRLGVPTCAYLTELFGDVQPTSTYRHNNQDISDDTYQQAAADNDDNIG